VPLALTTVVLTAYAGTPGTTRHITIRQTDNDGAGLRGSQKLPCGHGCLDFGCDIPKSMMGTQVFSVSVRTSLSPSTLARCAPLFTEISVESI
jgi:hypothetical protein